MQIKKTFTISPWLFFFNMQANLWRVPTAHPNVRVFNVYTSYRAENFNSVWKQAFPQISLNTLNLTNINTSLELPEIFGKEQKLFSWFWSHSLFHILFLTFCWRGFCYIWFQEMDKGLICGIQVRRNNYNRSVKQWGFNRNMSISENRGFKDLVLVLFNYGISLNFFYFQKLHGFKQEAK